MDVIKLDEDFKYGLILMKPLILELKAQNSVRLCRMWIEKLIQCSPLERKLRNLYLEQLCRHAEQHDLGQPFSNPPVEGPLPMIPNRFLITQGVILAEETTSWSDVSESSYGSRTWSDDRGYPIPILRSLSTTSTGDETTGTYRKNSARRPYVKHSPLYKQNRLRRHCKKPTTTESQDELPSNNFCKSPTRTESLISKSRQKMKRKNKKERIKSKATFSNPGVETHEIVNEDFTDKIKKSDRFHKAKQNILKKKLNKEIPETEIEKEEEDDDIAEVDLKDAESTLMDKLSKLKEENSELNKKLQCEKDQKGNVQKQKEALKNELVQLKNKLLHVERVKSSMEREHKNVTRRMSDSLEQQGRRVATGLEKNGNIESSLTDILSNLDIKGTTGRDALEREWIEKYKAVETGWKEKISEIENKHSQSVQGYESTVNELKKEISKKHKEYTKLEKQLQGQCVRMKTEVGNIKLEIERSAKDSELQLNIKLCSYRRKIARLINKHRETIRFYVDKINKISKVKDVELLIQKHDTESLIAPNKQQELEQMFNQLVEEFRKYHSDVTRWAYHNEQDLKYTQITPELKRDISIV